MESAVCPSTMTARFTVPKGFAYLMGSKGRAYGLAINVSITPGAKTFNFRFIATANLTQISAPRMGLSVFRSSSALGTCLLSSAFSVRMDSAVGCLRRALQVPSVSRSQNAKMHQPRTE